MMSSDLYFRDKIPVAVAGVRNEIGQKLVQLLAHHPWFEIAYLCDAVEWVGQTYGKVISESAHLPDSIKNMQVQPFEMSFSCSLVFSSLSSDEALNKNRDLADAGYYVMSSAFHELNTNSPLIVAEVNRDQLSIFSKQKEGKGGVFMCPHPAAAGLALALKPLQVDFGLKAVHAVASQPFHEGLSKNSTQEISFYINSEEENRQIEKETLQILGQCDGDHLQPAAFKMSAQGMHLGETSLEILSVSVKFQSKVEKKEILQSWLEFGEGEKRLQLPGAPYQPLHYIDPFEKSLFLEDKKMSVYLGELSRCAVLDFKFSGSFDPLMRGIIGSMLLNAELLVAQGVIYW